MSNSIKLWLKFAAGSVYYVLNNLKTQQILQIILKKIFSLFNIVIIVALN